MKSISNCYYQVLRTCVSSLWRSSKDVGQISVNYRFSEKRSERQCKRIRLSGSNNRKGLHKSLLHIHQGSWFHIRAFCTVKGILHHYKTLIPLIETNSVLNTSWSSFTPQFFSKDKNNKTTTAPEEAFKTFEELESQKPRLGLRSTPFMSIKLLNEMIWHNIKPDIAIFNKIIYELAWNEDYREMERWFRKITEHGLKPNCGSYNALMYGYAKQLDLKKCLKALNHMKKNGVNPDGATFTRLLYCLHRGGPNGDPMEIYNLMRNMNVKPTPKTFYSLLRALADRGKVEDATAVFQDMVKQKIRIELPHYNAILRCLERAGMLEEMTTWVEAMKKRNIEPNELSYCLLMKALGIRGMEEETIQILNKMKQREIQPSRTTFHTMIYISGYLNKFEETLAWVDEMMIRGIKPVSKTFDLIFFVMAKNKNTQVLPQVLDLVVKSGISLTPSQKKLIERLSQDTDK